MLSDQAVETLFERFEERFPDVNRVPDKVETDPFRSLVSVMLSAQSRDEMTAKARDQLFAVADTPQAILALPEERVARLIKPCGLYNMKAKSLHRMCRALLDEHAGRVPADRKTLTRLPGVGRKSADIILRFTFGEPVVAVDTHVHRVCNRLGLAFGKTEAQTAAQLEPRVPKRFGFGAHIWLLEHGKRLCKSRTPQCEACFLEDLCEKNPAPPKGKKNR